MKRKQLVRICVGILRALLARFALRGVKSDSRGPLEKVARRLLDECNAEDLVGVEREARPMWWTEELVNKILLNPKLKFSRTGECCGRRSPQT